MNNVIQHIDEFLYVWKIPTSSQNAYIIGMEKSRGSRDDEYLNKANTKLTAANKIFNEQLTTDYPTDHKIHDFLRDNCGDKFSWDGPTGTGLLKHTREAFTINKGHTEEELLETLSMLLTQHPDSYMRVNDFGLRNYQQDLLEKCVDILKNHNECCLQLSTRGGKSFLTLKIAQECNAKNILILTPMPMAKTSFIDVAQKHKDFTGWKFTDGVDITTATEFAADKNICLVSFQLFDADKQKIQNMLQKVGFDFIIIDEAHNTSDSARSQEILEKNFKNATKLYTSGTFYNDIYSRRFSPDVMVNFDFIDLIKLDNKTNEVKFPKLIINNVCNMNEIKAELIRVAEEKGWKKVLSSVKENDCFDFKAVFSSEKHIETFFDWALPKLKCVEGINEDSWLEDKNKNHHILMFVPSLRSTKNLKNVIDRYINNPDSILFGYHVEFISGLTENENDHQEQSKNVEEKYNKIMDKYEKTLFISVDRMTTGVTLKKLDTVFMMRNISSAEKFVQILFRTMTPYVDKKGNKLKKSAKLYNFNSDTTLKVVKNYIGTCKIAKEQSDKESIEELFDCIAINELVSGKQYKFESVSATEYLEKVKEIPLDYIQDDIFDLDKTNSVLDLYKDVLSNLDIKIEKSGALNITESKASAVIETKTKGTKQTSETSSSDEKVEKTDEEKKDQMLYEKVMEILKHLDYEVLCNNVRSFDDLTKIKITDKNNKAFCEEYDAEIQTILQEIFKANKVSISNFIDDINHNFDSNAKEAIYHLSRFDETDRSTPKVLIDRMYDKYSDELKQQLKAGEGIILDPCCGAGAMLLYLHHVVGIPKDCIYGMDLYEKNVSICHRLGFKNVVQGDATKPNIGDYIEKKLEEMYK